jgi:uncharacterized protein (DUF2252 family)
MTDFVAANAAYEQALAAMLPTLKADLALKHRRMAGDGFSFLRASFFRWAALFGTTCAELAKSPLVLGVGDLHVENFGTWRDAEARLIWGINDFDEATVLPYANDLVRLGTSALLAIEQSELRISPARACASILDGYTRSLAAGGRPLVLAERHRWLREIAVERLKDQRRFWQKLDALPSCARGVSSSLRELLADTLPGRRIAFRIVHRQAGLGSLGRPRFMALAPWDGGQIAREIKPMLVSAWDLPTNGRIAPTSAKLRAGGKIRVAQIIAGSVRAFDPLLSVHRGWLVRRIAPDCSRIELSSLPRKRDEGKLLTAMGWETANVHLGSSEQCAAIRRDLKRRGTGWLYEAATAMAVVTERDFRRWRAYMRRR